jgi:hypothetical protein
MNVDDMYPTNMTMAITTRKPSPGMLFGYPNASLRSMPGNNRFKRLGNMPSMKLNREITAQAVMTIGANIISPWKKIWMSFLK